MTTSLTNSVYIQIPDEEEKNYLHREAVMNLHYDFWCKYEDVLKKIKILDPSVGSGAFLNQCFDYLHEQMDEVLAMKRSFDKQISVFDIDRQILQNNLYGVDINAESVEITKLALWLKTAKNDQTLASLDNNIMCGNSLVNDIEIANELAFDWGKEFPQIIRDGGFDIVIGNPPYGATISTKEKQYIKRTFKTTEGYFDTYKTFFELGFSLLKKSGYLGFITPNTYFTLERSSEKLRRYLFNNNTLLNIVEIFNVFPNAVVEPIISIYKKGYDPTTQISITIVPRNVTLSSNFINDGITTFKKQVELKNNKGYLFNYKISDIEKSIHDKISSISQPLNEVCFVYNGAKPYEVGKGTPPQTKVVVKSKLYNSYNKEDNTWIPYMRGKSIQRYTNKWDGEYIKYGIWLAAPRNFDIFNREKIFVRQTGDSLISVLDVGNVSNNTLHIIYTKEDKNISNIYILGLLNSKLLNWIYQFENPTEIKKPLAEVKAIFLKKLPIIISNKTIQLQVEELVTLLLEKHQNRYNKVAEFIKYLSMVYEPKRSDEKIDEFYNLSFKEFVVELRKHRAKLSPIQQIELMPLFEDKKSEWHQFKNEINFLENKLDNLVYNIYKLNENDIKIIESGLI